MSVVPKFVRRAADARRYRARCAAVWNADSDRLRRLVAAADRTELFLHLPKTGGSSLTLALARDPRHLLVQCPRTYWTPGPLPSERHLLRSVDPALGAGRTVVLKFGHERYAAAEWLARRAGGPPIVTWTIVRPARSRLRSMFTDYWMRVAEAEKVERGAPVEPHRRPVLSGYRADAVHYRDPDGAIDGRAWFTAFAAHGSGMPFFLDEVFGTPHRLRRLLDRGAVVAIPTTGVDALMAERGLENVRQRVSTNRDDPPVRDALAASADLVDELARRDADYDRVLADHLGDPAFLP